MTCDIEVAEVSLDSAHDEKSSKAAPERTELGVEYAFKLVALNGRVA